MTAKTILKDNHFDIKISGEADEEILDILNHSVQGAEGGLIYSLRNIKDKIDAYEDKIRFISLYKKNKVEETTGACFHNTSLNGRSYPSTFIKYLAFLSTYKTETGHYKTGHIIYKSNDLFKQKTLELFNSPDIFDLPDISRKPGHVSYAFTENMNEKAKNIIQQAGFKHIRSFLTLAFSRFNPKTDSGVSRLEQEYYPQMQSLLNDFYRNYSLFQTEYSFTRGKYYVLRENGEIIAGVSVYPSSFSLYNVPGIWGWIIKKILPHAPGYKKLISLKEDFKFLTFDAIYCKPGRESTLSVLFESVCAKEGFFSGLAWLDDRSVLYDTIRTEVKMGPLNRMLNAKPGLIYAKFFNLSKEEQERFYDAPAYVSGFDFT